VKLDDTLGFSFAEVWEQNREKLMDAATKTGMKSVTKLMESPKTQQALYGVADKLVDVMVPSDPRAAEERVRQLASTAAKTAGQTLATQAKGEISDIQETLKKYLPYVKPAAVIVAGVSVLLLGVATYRTFAYKKK
jgi:hypothetical protein